MEGRHAQMSPIPASAFLYVLTRGLGVDDCDIYPDRMTFVKTMVWFDDLPSCRIIARR